MHPSGSSSGSRIVFNGRDRADRHPEAAMESYSGRPAPHPEDAPILDTAAFRRTTLENTALQRRILMLCLTTTDGLDRKIEQHVAQDLPETGQILHFCKGVFMNVRASRLVATLEAMESSLRENARETCLALVPTFLEEFAKARSAVSELLAELERN